MMEKQLLKTIESCLNSEDNTSAFVKIQLVKFSNILKQTKVEDKDFMFIMSDLKDIIDGVLSAYSTEEIVNCLKTSFIKTAGGSSSEVHVAEALRELRILNRTEYLDIVASH